MQGEKGMQVTQVFDHYPRAGQAMQSQAAALGEKIRAEDSVAKAVEIVHNYLKK